jgi:hypothetical protein
VRDAFDALVAVGRARVAGAAVQVGPPTVASDTLISAARDHGMLGLLADALRGDGPDAKTAAIRAAWRVDVANALAAGRTAVEVYRALASAGVASVAYKGPALAAQAYGDATLRACEDVDVIVAPRDVVRAADALRGIGFAPPRGMSWRRASAEGRWVGQLALVRSDGGLPVDVHWRLCGRSLPWSPPIPELIARAAQVTIGGHELPVLEPHDAVVLVLLHSARHAWDKLEPFVAVGMLVGSGLDGTELLKRAGCVGGRRALLTGLEVARRLLGAALPASVTEAIRSDGRVSPLADDAEARLRRGSLGTRRDARLHLALLDSAVARARYLAVVAVDPTPADFAAVRLPRGLRWAYYGVRPARLVLRALGGGRRD